MKTLGVMVGNEGGSKAAYTTMAKAAMGVLPRRRNWLTCRRLPLAKFLCGAAGGELATELWRWCIVFESRWLPAMLPHDYSKGTMARMGYGRRPCGSCTVSCHGRSGLSGVGGEPASRCKHGPAIWPELRQKLAAMAAWWNALLLMA